MTHQIRYEYIIIANLDWEEARQLYTALKTQPGLSIGRTSSLSHTPITDQVSGRQKLRVDARACMTMDQPGGTDGTRKLVSGFDANT